MVKRPTIADVAQASGVSVATVDRVLNGRLPVREDTARRVQRAANAIGFHAAGLIEERARQRVPRYRLGFLLLSTRSHFYADFTRAVEVAASATVRARVIPAISHWTASAPESVAGKIEALADSCNAIAVISHDHPSVSAAVAACKARGIPVIALLSDFALGLRDGYIGVDNRKVGRTAAWMIARTAPQPGKVAVLLGSHNFHGHELREAGLRSYFREHAPAFTVLETQVVYEDSDRACRAMREILETHPDLSGCFVAAGEPEGAIAAVRAARPAQPPAMVCSEITSVTRAALVDNTVTMVVATPLARLCHDAIAMMAETIETGRPGDASQILLPFDIHLPESV